jgi:hypothetical protein
LHIWRGRDPIEDTVSLAQAVAASSAELFRTTEGQLVRVSEGRLVPVGRDGLCEIAAEHVWTRKPVNRGTATEPIWEVEYGPFDFAPGTDLSRGPNDRVLMTLLTGRALERMPPGSAGNEFERGAVAYWVPKV